MSENKELKKGNGQDPETETTEEGVCSSLLQW